MGGGHPPLPLFGNKQQHSVTCGVPLQQTFVHKVHDKGTHEQRGNCFVAVLYLRPSSLPLWALEFHLFIQ